MNTCNNRAFIKPFLDGVLTEAEAVRFEDHLAACSGCREELARLETNRTEPRVVEKPGLATPWRQALAAVAAAVPREPKPSLNE